MADSLDIEPFKHALMPVGVLVGLGLSRVVVAVSLYIEHRERIRYVPVHAIWTCILLLLFVGIWWALWQLRTIEAEVMTFPLLIYLLVGPCLMYLPSTLLLPPVPESGQLDLSDLFERVGRPVFLSLGAFFLWAVSLQIFLRGHPPLDVPRISQGILVMLYMVAAVFPSRRIAAVLGSVTLVLVSLSLAFVRGKLS